jgi:hypothetical protein
LLDFRYIFVSHDFVAQLLFVHYLRGSTNQTHPFRAKASGGPISIRLPETKTLLGNGKSRPIDLNIPHQKLPSNNQKLNEKC